MTVEHRHEDMAFITDVSAGAEYTRGKIIDAENTNIPIAITAIKCCFM
jgi:hypothetical protein